MPWKPFLCTALLLIFASTLAFAQMPVGEVFAADTSLQGSVLYAGSGTKVLSGSQVSAGARPAVLKLSRGGEVRICPNTSLGVAASPGGRNLLFSVSQGEVEFHFNVAADGDALQTPDFRVQFIGPGRFDIAMCMDKVGGLSLRGNNNHAAVIVSEMMGDGMYQVPGGGSVDFHGGSVREAVPSNAPCGCPEPPAMPNSVVAQQPPAAPTPAPAASAPAPQPPVTAQETHLQMDAPFVFHGDDLHQEIVHTLAQLQVVKAAEIESKLQPQVQPPAPPEPEKQATVPQKKKSFFGKIGSFFGKLFKS